MMSSNEEVKPFDKNGLSTDCLNERNQISHDLSDSNDLFVMVNDDLYRCYYECLSYVFDNDSIKMVEDKEFLQRYQKDLRMMHVFKRHFDGKSTKKDENMLLKYVQTTPLSILLKQCFGIMSDDILRVFNSCSNDEVFDIIDYFDRNFNGDKQGKIVASYLKALLTNRMIINGSMALKKAYC